MAATKCNKYVHNGNGDAWLLQQQLFYASGTKHGLIVIDVQNV